jgi:exopolysaccharide biosynthesis polyprenyl glycosylphosphotransferase
VLALVLFLGYWECLCGWGVFDELRFRLTPSCRKVAAFLLGSIPLAPVPLAHHAGFLGIPGALMFGVIASIAVCGLQLVGHVARQIPRSRELHNVLIVGSGPRALATYHHLTTRASRPQRVLGFIDDEVQPDLGRSGLRHMGQLDELETVLEGNVVDEVHVALPVKSRYPEFQQAISVCEQSGTLVSYRLDPFLHVRETGLLKPVAGSLAVRLRPVPHADSLLFKRTFDVLAALALLVVLSPVMALVGLGVSLSSPGPVLFSQERFGRNKRRFRMYKFRSMRVDAEEMLRQNKLPEREDPRITPLGRWLRKTSLDELPQLWNVLRGDMAIVGPRPVVPAELVHYGAGAALLLALKPGLTSAWVLGGRSSVGYPRRAELELNYVRDWSLTRDAQIFLKTLPVILSGKGAY